MITMNLLEKEQLAINDIKVFIERGATKIDLRPLYFACGQNQELCASIIKAHIKEPIWFESFNGGMRIDYWVRLDGFDVERYYIPNESEYIGNGFYPQPYVFYDWSYTLEGLKSEMALSERQVERSKATTDKKPWYKRLFK
jgi:hypothetical protein